MLEAAETAEDNNMLREKYSESLRLLEQLCDKGELVLSKKNIEKLQFYL